MDLVLSLDRAVVTEADVRAEVLSTFLCAANPEATTCATCHPTCESCTDDLCDPCKSAVAAKIADGAFCQCGQSPTLTACSLCHASCATCAAPGNDPEACTECTIAEATLSNPLGGHCSCGLGYVAQSPATAACVSCSSSCSYCVGSSEEACMGSEDLNVFATNLALAQMPLLSQTNGLICYRQPVPALSCDPLTPITGAITTDASGLHPTLDQCYKLLKVQWPMVGYWFNQIFPDFNPPNSATEAETYQLKAVLKLLILQFGPSVLKNEVSWQALVAVFNNASLDWEQLLGWTDGYLAAGSVNTYPALWTPSAFELSLFNSFSKVCDAANCGYQTECQEVAASSTCATP